MNSLNIPTFGASTSINVTIDQTSIDNVRNHLFPHAICAIADLLYWFAREADLLPTPLTYAYVQELMSYIKEVRVIGMFNKMLFAQ